MELFKVLSEDGCCCHGGQGHWNLPSQNSNGEWAPGEWMTPIQGDLIACRNGYHLCRANDLLSWLGPAIYSAEHRGDHIDTSDKIIVREARLLQRLNWDDRVARLFACDCAEHVLSICEHEYPDGSPRKAIEVARRYANGEATEEELYDANLAARSAARNVGSSRDWATAWSSVQASEGTPGWIAGNAAQAAAMDAVGYAARDTEYQWQTTHLLKYLYG